MNIFLTRTLGHVLSLQKISYFVLKIQTITTKTRHNNSKNNKL